MCMSWANISLESDPLSLLGHHELVHKAYWYGTVTVVCVTVLLQDTDFHFSYVSGCKCVTG